jgi:O-antigen ligase
MRAPSLFSSHPLVLIALLLACALPPLVGYSMTPSATLFNQLAALGSWGLVLVVAARAQPVLRGGPAVWAVALLVLAPWVSWAWAGLPLSLALSNSGMLGAALLLLLAGQGIATGAARQSWFEALCWGLLLAGGLSVVVSLMQVFAPGLTDGKWIAHSGIPGRAVGNMRQPNHLASLLMWACVAAVYLADQQRFKNAAAALPALLFALVFAVVLSASRTGMLGVAILAVWGALDRKLARPTRYALLATPLMLAFCWWALSVWASSGAGHAFGAESRLAEGAGSPARMAILANAWELVRANPWTGVGWGEFNLAWTMTPFPQRPIAFFDHTHDLPMQLAVELGLPACLAILSLLGWALWRAFRTSMVEQGADAVMRRCAVLLIVTIGLHSLLEYPLWYGYFLMPTAFALGLAIGAAAPTTSRGWPMQRGWAGLGVLLVASSVYAAVDYLDLVAIYAPPKDAGPLSARIAVGQRSLLFSSLADYAAATSLGANAEALAAAKRTAHNLIDARLMKDWAQSLHATGDDDRARYVVQRLREFRNKIGDDWLAECELPLTDGELAWQCAPPLREYNWREMR